MERYCCCYGHVTSVARSARRPPYPPHQVERGMRRQLPMPVCVVWGAKDHALITKNLDGVNLVGVG